MMYTMRPGGEYGEFFLRLRNVLENRKVVWSTFDTMSPYEGITSEFRIISQPLIYRREDDITKFVIPIGLGITVNGVKVGDHYPIISINGDIVRFDLPYQPYVDNDNVEWFYHTLTAYGEFK